MHKITLFNIGPFYTNLSSKAFSPMVHFQKKSTIKININALKNIKKYLHQYNYYPVRKYILNQFKTMMLI